MRKSGSLLKVAALLVPMIVGCAAQGDESSSGSSMPTADAVEASYQALAPQLPRKDLPVRSTRVGPDGTVHVKMQQTYQGIPVFEGEVITHVDPKGNVTKTDALRTLGNLDITPSVTRDEAISLARTAGPDDGSVQVAFADLVILPRGDHGNADRLAWHVRLASEGGEAGAAQWDSFYDARNMRLLLAFDTLETSQVVAKGRTAWTGTNNMPADRADANIAKWTLLDGKGNTTCDMNNKTSGTCTPSSTTATETFREPVLAADGTPVLDADGNPTSQDVVYPVFGNNAPDLTNRNTAAADAHYGMQMTLAYYASAFGRNGIDGLGTKTQSRVHYGSSYENAFWSDTCFCMTYGDGGATLYPLTTLDVAGHEMSHGVMAKEANLTYRGESGGLNESNSDIFGTMVEFYANSAVDTPDYFIGERLYKSSASKMLRNMADPFSDGKSPACYTTKTKSLDVHYSSGANNHMFYLLAEGGVSKCNGKTVTGIGRERAARIWYDAIANQMTASTTYAGARVAAIAAAKALENSTDPAVAAAFAGTSAAVAAAYSAINVN